MKDEVGALGASVIVHDVVICLLIMMAIIFLLEMAPRLVAITTMPGLLWVLVASAVTVVVAICNHVDCCSCINCNGDDDSASHYNYASNDGRRGGMAYFGAHNHFIHWSWHSTSSMISPFLLLKLVKNANYMIHILTLFEEADEWV